VDGLYNIQTFVKFKKFNFGTDLLAIMKVRERKRMFGLGKPRSRFKKFLDKNGLSQQDVVKESGVNRGTISRICQGDAFQPSLKNGNKIIKALKKLTGKNVDYNDFWM
jgi:DNA-binding XRE family transcriptional regulator